VNSIHPEGQNGASEHLADEEVAADRLHLAVFNSTLRVHLPLLKDIDFRRSLVLEQDLVKLVIILTLLGAARDPVAEDVPFDEE